MHQKQRRLSVVLGLLILFLGAYCFSLVALTFFQHPDFHGERFCSQVFTFASESWKGFLLSVMIVGLIGGPSTLLEKRPIVQFLKAQVLVIGTCFVASLLFFYGHGLFSDLQGSDRSVVLSLVSYGLSQGLRATVFCLPVSVPSGIVLVWLIRQW